MFANMYCSSSVKPKSLSPLHQELAGLPDLLIHVGDDEVILSDSLLLAEHAEKAGVNVTLKVWGNMWHAFHGFAGLMPEARRALNQIGIFVRRVMF